MNDGKERKRMGNRNAVGPQLPKNGSLFRGDGCTIGKVRYRCLENCPFPDDCHYDSSNKRVLRRAVKRLKEQI